MDPALTEAARALSRGDPLHALKQVALRNDASALALRGTALAQLGEYQSARRLLVRAERAFAGRDPLAHARCVVARVEVSLAARELRAPEPDLAAAIAELQRRGDRTNAQYARLLAARYALCLGDLASAKRRLTRVEARRPALRALRLLVEAELALRELAIGQARHALARAAAAARSAAIPALSAEIERTAGAVDGPAARLSDADGVRPVSLAQVARLRDGDALVVDVCRRAARDGASCVSFATRPIPFMLLRELAEAAPRDVARAALIARVFGIARESPALRARLRVEIGRLRKLLSPVGTVAATPRGFRLQARAARVCVLLPAQDDQASQLCALIADGAAWSSSALALALGTSQRSVQRSLRELEQAGKLRCAGRGRNRRWLALPLTPITSNLLFHAPLRGP